MRLEELLGLRWEDVELDYKYLTIVRTVTRPKNNGYHIDTPKSKRSARTVPIVSAVDALLRPHKNGAAHSLWQRTMVLR